MEPQTKQQKIVVVEDNPALAEIYKTRLEILGYAVSVAYDGTTALVFIQRELPDLVLMDLMIPDLSGDQVLARMRNSLWGKNIPVYVMSNLNEADAPPTLRQLGIAGYAVKANMHDDDVDKIVNSILRPDGQAAGSAPAH